MKYSTLQDHKFFILPSFLSEEEAEEMKKTFVDYCNENKIGGDAQVPQSRSVGNFTIFTDLLHQRTPSLSHLLGIELLPTYTYARVYLKGATLPAHWDREACEISVSVHLGGDVEWPLTMGSPLPEKRDVNLNVGDAVIYLGREVEHSRESFTGEEYVQVFLHYVNSKGLCARCF